MSSEIEGTSSNRPVDCKETAKGLAAGAAGGVAQVLIGEKTRIEPFSPKLQSES